MYLEIYVDIIFIINFIMDFLLLYIVKKILKWETSFKRLILGATAGGLGACFLALLPELNQVIQFVLSYFVICAIMVGLTFRPKTWYLGLKSMIILYVGTFFLGGVFNSLYYHSMLGYYFHELINGRIFKDLKGWKIVVLIVLGLIGLYTLVKVMNNLKGDDKRFYETNLYHRDKSISLTALLDTGNNLYDPIFKKPVIIIEYSSLKKLLSNEESRCIDKLMDNPNIENPNIDNPYLDSDLSYTADMKVFMIPYTSIGKKKGVLPAIELDKIEILQGSETIYNEKVLTGIWKGQFNKENKYQLILHRDLT